MKTQREEMEPRSRRCGRAETFEKVRCGRRTAFNPIIHQYIFMAVTLRPSFGRRTSRECFRPGCTGVAPRPKYRGSWCKSHPCGKLRPKHRGRSFAQERFRMTALQSVGSTTGRWGSVPAILDRYMELANAGASYALTRASMHRRIRRKLSSSHRNIVVSITT